MPPRFSPGRSPQSSRNALSSSLPKTAQGNLSAEASEACPRIPLDASVCMSPCPGCTVAEQLQSPESPLTIKCNLPNCLSLRITPSSGSILADQLGMFVAPWSNRLKQGYYSSPNGNGWSIRALLHSLFCCLVLVLLLWTFAAHAILPTLVPFAVPAPQVNKERKTNDQL